MTLQQAGFQGNTQIAGTHLSAKKPRIRFRLIGFIFYAVLFILFCFTGVLDVVTARVFRLSLVSLAIMPLVIFYRPVIDGVSLTLAALTGTVALSALFNGSTFLQMASVIRVPIFAYLIYFLSYRYINAHRARTILRVLLIIAAIQLPIILLQWRVYPHLPTHWQQSISPFDIGVGTFGLNRDYSMSFMLTILVIFLLFNDRTNLIVKHRWPWAVWLTITVLIANSEILRLTMILVWAVYLLLHFRLKTVLMLAVIAVVLLAVLSLLATENLMGYGRTLQRLTRDISSQQEGQFLEGAYTRNAAIYYYLHDDLRIIGDGPAKYANSITRERYLGNHGHAFNFYAELGIVGLLLSYIALFLIACPVRLDFREPNVTIRISFSAMRVLSFIAIVILSLTAFVMNDISVMFSYCVVLRSSQALGPQAAPQAVVRKEDHASGLPATA